MTLPKSAVEKFKFDYQREADYTSARGAAEQVGKAAEFDAAMKENADQDPWDLTRSLLGGRNEK